MIFNGILNGTVSGTVSGTYISSKGIDTMPCKAPGFLIYGSIATTSPLFALYNTSKIHCY